MVYVHLKTRKKNYQQKNLYLNSASHTNCSVFLYQIRVGYSVQKKLFYLQTCLKLNGNVLKSAMFKNTFMNICKVRYF